jgi:hypothetical protein
LAGDLALIPMIQREAMGRQLRRNPSLCKMAILALQSEKPGMDSWLCMALHTFCRRASKPLFSVTLSALKLGVATI